MRVFLILAAFIIFAATALAVSFKFIEDAQGQGITTPALRLAPLGYCQITLTGTAAGLSTCSGGIPARSTAIYLVVETAAARFRDDGVAPTTTVGMPIAINGSLFYAGNISALLFIAQTGSPVLNVLFYNSP